jgi:hypothetical protein
MSVNATSESNRTTVTTPVASQAPTVAVRTPLANEAQLRSGKVVGDSGIRKREPSVTPDVMAAINRSGDISGLCEVLSGPEIVERAANWVVDGKLRGVSRFWTQSLTRELAGDMKRKQDAAWKKVNDAAIGGFMAGGLAGFMLAGLTADAAPPKYSRAEIKKRAHFELLTAARALVVGDETPNRLVSAKAYELVRREIAAHHIPGWEKNCAY